MALSPASPDVVEAKPSLRLLFAFLTRRDMVCLLLPSMVLSMAVGVVPAVMSKAIGHSFNAFTTYNPTALPSASIEPSAKSTFLNQVLETVYVLLGLAVGTMLVSTVAVSAWICLGERLACRMRTAVFDEVMGKRMCWFDLGMGLSTENTQEQQDISPAGLMAKVAREIDDARTAVGRQLGDVVQHLTTAVASLALALYSSWNLTLVVLASIPVILFLTVVTEVGAAAPLQRERVSTARATGLVERVVQAINTVKAFNAESKERLRFQSELRVGCTAYRRVLLWWATRFGTTAGLVFAMFVQGFWYGSHLVQHGKLTPGDVLTVFMASLLVSGMLNQIVQSLASVEKGKVGAANIINLINSVDHVRSKPCSPPSASARAESTFSNSSSSLSDDVEKRLTDKSTLGPKYSYTEPSSAGCEIHEFDIRKARAVPMAIEAIPHSPDASASPDTLSFRTRAVPYASKLSPTAPRSRRVQGLRRISPPSCQGEIHFRNVSFSYPSRPTAAVLRNATLYFPASELTYVVGGSGSGKSTVAQLLLRLYEPSHGTIQIDDQTIEYLDPNWCRNHIGAVSQNPIIFDMSIHDNVALGLVGRHPQRRSPSESQLEISNEAIPVVPRDQIEAACRLALLHDFIRDLPHGYDTLLGSKGTSLSGGQRQRLAIARAKLRDPSILILDEATSALDPTSRLLVHEAIKTWRRGKTTIVITHDLSQIEHDDFVYLLEDGVVAEQGYRSDLELKGGAFHRIELLRMSCDSFSSPRARDSVSTFEDASRSSGKAFHGRLATRRYTAHRSLLGWERDSGVFGEHLSYLVSQKLDQTPSHLKPLRLAERQAMQSYYDDAETLRASGASASARRAASGDVRTLRRRWDQPADSLTVDMDPASTRPAANAAPIPSTKRVAFIVWNTIPSRALLVFGLLLCVVAGTMTPIFSYMLAQLLSTMSKADQNAAVLKWSLLVLLIALLECMFSFSRFLLMETIADVWITRLRNKSYANVLRQDRTWFDEPGNSADKICQSIVKDADDARNLVGQIVGQLALVCSMITLGIVWALVVGWQLTLVGIAFAPVFIVALFLQSRVMAHHEARNKLKRELVSERFYAAISNVRSIRAMGLESVFSRAHATAVAEAQSCAIRSSVYAGFGHALSDALTYIAEALMFYVGAKLMVAGSYDFGRMIQVFNLIIFAVTFAAQMLTFLPGLSKSTQALVDLDRLLKLDNRESHELGGTLTPTVWGRVRFEDVTFSYPSRPDVSVLQGVSFEIAQGECVAIVGGSGSGKSTIAALLQRLYEPDRGAVVLDHTPVQMLSTEWLREHISVVSQSPNLFDMSIGDNIVYGANSHGSGDTETTANSPRTSSDQRAIESAARSAQVDDFVRSLPRGYDTQVSGGDSSKLSGGQAQRIAIARAFMRTKARILILDECTSALDVHNQRAILETLTHPASPIKQQNITTVIITHNLDLMRQADRILVLNQGKVVEQGSFTILTALKHGHFAALAKAGEWSG
ncbi:P-loop containing nucleoside triphosphate hydrolase protein [Testicularia cyperi]|uniref:P-loop containing nucleoside triphosphate hydrolase protein n=1 Tax=Testicularia cyperi TaxID=1882483 RepID=A0A317XNQ2_9BASI|nr:P-loop containing nucleoside triphosphate hydrolase protein [Testicularia cyperi]